MRKVTKTSTCKRYHIEPDGSLKFLGTFTYTYTEEVAPVNRTRVLAQTERMIAAAYAKQLADEESFERLVDAAADVASYERED